MPRQRRAPHVHKFGGASLADSAAVRRAVDIIQSHHAEPTVVVVSAMAGVTDALLAVAQQAGSGDERTLAALIGQLRTRHAEVARALLPSGRSRTDMLAHIAEVFEELEALAAGLRRLRELTPRTTDLVISRGERLSARLLSGALEASGTKARYVDALEVVHTDDVFGQASPDFDHTDRSVQRTLGPIITRGVIPIVPGFIGATPAGEVATLGRGGRASRGRAVAGRPWQWPERRCRQPRRHAHCCGRAARHYPPLGRAGRATGGRAAGRSARRPGGQRDQPCLFADG